MDWIRLLTLPSRPVKLLCHVPRDLSEVLDRGEEAAPRELGLDPAAVERVWRAVEAVYRTGLYPAIQVCIRHRGGVVLHRALGHASGGGPRDRASGPRVPVAVDTPFRIYSASKALSAMVIHKLDELRVLHIDDRACEYLDELRGGAGEAITIAHVLAHRAGFPAPPPGAMDLDLVARHDEIVRLIAEMPLRSRPGRSLAYHAVTGGFVLSEIARRATGRGLRALLREHVSKPLGLRQTDYGIAAADAHRVARDAITGIPPLPPFSQLFRRALGVTFERAVEMAHDPRFLRAVIPSANVVTTAADLSAFYECLLQGGERHGVHVFEPRTVRRATVEQSIWEVDLTLGVPVRYALGFMLGAEYLSLFGPDTHRAFGHLGLTNIFSWADPRRHLAVAILTSGKPFLNLEFVRLYRLLIEIGRAFPKD